MSLEAESEAETTAASKDYDLLVIGPGHLGARVATLWQQKFPNAMIALKANRQDLNREAKWHSLGFISHQEEENGRKYNYVLFSAPPSGAENYFIEVTNALSNYTHPKSRFVFTSSGGVFTENEGGIVNEESNVVSSEDTSRKGHILKAEKAVLEHLGGIVLRLAGLYTLNRGAHNFWLSDKVLESPSSPNGLINLIHYDDAAQAVLLAFESGDVNSQEVFLLSDGQPLSRQQICESALLNPLFQGSEEGNEDCKNKPSAPLFKGPTDQIDGKRYNVAKAESRLLWRPKFTNFSSFMDKTYVHEMKVPLIDYKV